MENIKARIKKLRKAAGYTQIALAKRAKLSQANITAYERGHAVPGGVSSRKLARAFKMSWSEFEKGVDFTKQPDSVRQKRTREEINTDGSIPTTGSMYSGGPTYTPAAMDSGGSLVADALGRVPHAASPSLVSLAPLADFAHADLALQAPAAAGSIDIAHVHAAARRMADHFREGFAVAVGLIALCEAAGAHLPIQSDGAAGSADAAHVDGPAVHRRIAR